MAEIVTLAGKFENKATLIEKLHRVDQWTARMVVDVHEGCKRVCSTVHENARKHWDQYMGGENAPRSENYQGYSRLFPNMTADICDALVAKYLLGLFPGNTEFFGVRGRNYRSIQNEGFVRKALGHYFERMRLFVSVAEWLLHCIVSGTGILQCGWLYEVAKEEVFVKPEGGLKNRRSILRILSRLVRPDEPMPEWEVKSIWAVIEDRPMLRNIPLEEFFVPDLRVDDIDDLDYAGTVYWKTRREILEDKHREIIDPETDSPTSVGTYRNTEFVPVYPMTTKDSAEDSGGGEDTIGYSAGDLPMTQSVECQEYTFRDIRALYDGNKDGWRRHLKKNWDFTDGDLEGGAIVTIADECVPIRIEPMADPRGRLSSVFVVQKYKPRKKSLDGKGVPESIRDEQIELASVRNQILDGVSKQLRRRTFVNANVQLPQGQLKRREHDQIIEVDSLEGGTIRDLIGYEEVPPVPPDAYGYASTLEIDIKNRTHVQDMTMGRPANKRMSATETAELSEGADTVFTVEIRLFEQGGLVKGLENIYRLVRRRMTKPLAIRIAGEHGAEIEEVEPEKLWGDYDFYLLGAREMSNRWLRLRNMLELLQNPAVAPILKMPKIVQRVFTILGEACPSDLVIDPSKPGRMMDVALQWNVFLQGEYVEVTGRESIAEHKEAISKHRERFLAVTVRELRKMGARPETLEKIVRAAERNIADHEHLLEKKLEELKRIEAMAMQKGAGGGGLGQLRGLPPPGGGNMGAELASVQGVSPVPGG